MSEPNSPSNPTNNEVANTNEPNSDVKPDVKPSQTHINIKVSDGSSEIFFKIKRSTNLRKLMQAFANRQGKDVNSLKFVFEGVRITGDHTPDDLAMEENDMIEVYREQLGGC
ncbi:SUMO protein smt3 [Hanseniaspora osmophila]|uniref:Ubiquitin-like protein SMT3 n=1 Tax=Hanseniaspora osmophila TaxID=56408 RepID=A0A1E5RI01_9ASCO|nr:Ubiquitin-like protein SMT3 [Hanseniaspora osmophila]